MLHASSYFGIAVTVTLRYVIIAGVAWLVYYRFLRTKISFSKIQQRFPSGKDYRREIGYSILTVFIFAAVLWVFISTRIQKYTYYYKHIHSRSMIYSWLALHIML